MKFPGQKPGEEVLMQVRRHWFTLLSKAVILFFAAFPPVVIGVLLDQYLGLFDDPAQLGYVLFVLAASTYALGLLLFFFIAWIDYYLDIWIVTRERILTIEQKGLFSRTISELALEKVQDVTSDVHGLIATMLKFGDIRIQTAGERSQFVFQEVPHPYETARKIMELHASTIPAVQVQQPVPPNVPPPVPPTSAQPTSSPQQPVQKT